MKTDGEQTENRRGCWWDKFGIVKVTESSKAKRFEIVRVPSGSDSSRQRQQIAGSNLIIRSDRTSSSRQEQAATSFSDVTGV